MTCACGREGGHPQLQPHHPSRAGAAGTGTAVAAERGMAAGAECTGGEPAGAAGSVGSGARGPSLPCKGSRTGCIPQVPYRRP